MCSGKHAAKSEIQRLEEDRRREKNWKRWGPYLSERQWGTIREDYSANGSSWTYFPHDQARSRVYRWGEDGLLGITDRECRLCFALALWNGQDPILKERLFGLANEQGNHGEDVKEVYFYLDSSPTHSYLKAMYRYPQSGISIRPARRGKSKTRPAGSGVRTVRYRRFRRQPVFRRDGGICQGLAGRHSDPYHRVQPW